MNLEQAFEQFLNSDEFKEIAKQNTPMGTKYRVYNMRFKNDELKAGAIVEILLANGYEVKAIRVSKVKHRTKKP